MNIYIYRLQNTILSDNNELQSDMYGMISFMYILKGTATKHVYVRLNHMKLNYLDQETVED